MIFLNINHGNNFVELDSIPISFRCFAVKIRASETEYSELKKNCLVYGWSGFGHSIQGKAILLL